MSNYAIQYQLTAKDALTPALRKALAMMKKIDQMAMRLNKPTRLNIDTRLAHQKIKQLETHARAAMAKTNAIGRSGAVTNAASVATRAGKGRLDVMQGAAGALGGYMFLRSAIDKGMEFQKVLVDTEKFSGKSGAALEAYKKMMIDLSNATGQSAVDVGLLTNEFIKLDDTFSLDELKRMSMMANQVSMAWDNIGAQAAGETLAVIKGQWKLTVDEVEKYANKIDYVSDKIANVNSDFLAEAIKENSGMAIANQIGFDQMTSFFAAADSAKADLSKAGGAFKLLLAGMRDEGNNKAFAKIGLGANFTSQVKVDPNKAIQDVISAMNAYKGDDLPELVSDIVGKNYNDTMLQVLTQGDKFHEAMSRLGETQNIDGRIAEGQKKYLDSAVGKLGVLKARYDNLFVNLFGNSKKLAKIFDVIGSGLDFIGRNPVIVEMGIALSVAAVSAGGLAIAIMAISSPIALMVAGIAAVILIFQQAWENSETLRGSFSSLGTTIFGTGDGAMYLADAFHIANMGITFFGIGVGTIITALDIMLVSINAMYEALVKVATFDFSGMKDVLGEAKDTVDVKLGNWAMNVESDVKRLMAAKLELDQVKADAEKARSTAGISVGGMPQPSVSKSAEAATAQKAAADTSKQAADTQKMSADKMGQAAAQMLNAANQMVNAANRPVTVNVSGGLGDQGR